MPHPLVLLVEDDPDTREMYAMFLGSMGYHIVQAADGKAALDAARDSSPDIVITDLAMPVMDGFCLTRELRAGTATQSVPIIAVTGHQVPTTARLAREAGCCCLFTKPFLPDSLLDAVRSMLDACPRSCVHSGDHRRCPVIPPLPQAPDPARAGSHINRSQS